MSDPIGQQLGQYQLTQLIHRRAMSAVYKAYQPSLDRFVAIKVLFSDGDPQFAMRFKRSARMSAALQHPNILPTYDFGEQDNILFIVLQYVEGGVTLDSLLGAPIEMPNAVLVMTRLLGALDYAHKRGIIHRDVKPANIMMSAPSWPLLGDFGIAKLRIDDQRFTSSGLTIGTPAYMAPEQATGRTVDVRTDVYAAGIIFYTMLTGRVPFDAETPMDMLAKHVYEQPSSPRTLNPDISIAAEQVILRALEKLPEARYQSAVAMAEAISDLAPEPELSKPAPPRSQSHQSSLYQAGAQALESGRWDVAINLLSQLVARDPTNDDAADMLAAAREMQRREHGEPARPADSIGQQTGEHMRKVGDPPRAKANEHAPHASAAPTEIKQQPDAPINTATAGLALEQPNAGTIVLECPRCGQQIRSDWSACPYCRATLSVIAAVQAPREPPLAIEKAAPVVQPHTHGRIGRAGLLALLILIAIGGTTALVLARRTPAPANPTVAPQAAVGRPTDAPAIVAFTPMPTSVPSSTPAASPNRAPTVRPSATAVVPPTASPAPTLPPPDAVVNIEQLRLRAGPSTNYAFQHTYPQGTALELLGKEPNGVWLNVRAPDGQTGWMRTSDLQINIALDTLAISEAPPSPTPPPPTRRPTERPPSTAAPPAAPAPTELPTDVPTELPTAAPAELPPTDLPTELPTPTEKKEDKPRPTRKPSDPTPPK